MSLRRRLKLAALDVTLGALAGVYLLVLVVLPIALAVAIVVWLIRI